MERFRRLDSSKIRSGENPSGVNVIDFIDMDFTQFEELEEAVADTGGIVEVLVHPFNPDHLKRQNDSREYHLKREELIANAFRNRIPLLIFEESRRVAQISKRLAQHSGKVYAVRTSEGESTPLYDTGDDSDKWLSLMLELSDLGVSQIRLGGVYLVNRPLNQYPETEALYQQNRKMSNMPKNVWYERGVFPDGCVGLAARVLSSTFDVKLSPAVYPANGFEVTPGFEKRRK